MTVLKFSKRKAIFVTFNRVGLDCLSEIVKSGLVKVDLVYTLKPKLTNGISDYQDVGPFCKKNKIPIKRISNINYQTSEIKTKRPDLIFVIGWSQILKKELLEIPVLGCIGFHPSLLPRNRGRAAIPWHFINNEKLGGATLFFLDEGCDSGDIIGQIGFVLTDKDNAKTYYQKAKLAAVKILHDSLPKLINNNLKVRKQDNNKANYLLIRNKMDSFLDFNAFKTKEIFNRIRAVAYIYPTAFAFYENCKVEIFASKIVPKKNHIYSATPGQVIKVFDGSVWVKTIDGIIELTQVYQNGEQINDYLSFFKIGHYFNRKAYDRIPY